MQLFGFNEKRQVVPVTMTPKAIANAGIHPYALDLFDDKPVAIKIRDQGTLWFTRLGASCFGFRDDSDPDLNFIGVTDGKLYLSFGGERGTEGGFSLKEHPRGERLVQGRKQFNWLFARYLKQRQNNDRWAMKMSDPRAIQLAGLNVVFDIGSVGIDHLEFDQVRFAGRMMERVPLRISMPDEVNWVFSAFADLNPEVFGGCLRDLVRGAAFKDVDFMTDAIGSEELTARLGRLGITNARALNTPYLDNGNKTGIVVEFERNGVSYNLVSRDGGTERFWRLNDFSVNQMLAPRPGLVHASRIALFDLGQGQFRSTSVLRPCEGDGLQARWCRRAAMLVERGFNFIETPFVPVVPNANAKGEDE